MHLAISMAHCLRRVALTSQKTSNNSSCRRSASVVGSSVIRAFLLTRFVLICFRVLFPVKVFRAGTRDRSPFYVFLFPPPLSPFLFSLPTFPLVKLGRLGDSAIHEQRNVLNVSKRRGSHVHGTQRRRYDPASFHATTGRCVAIKRKKKGVDKQFQVERSKSRTRARVIRRRSLAKCSTRGWIARGEFRKNVKRREKRSQAGGGGGSFVETRGEKKRNNQTKIVCVRERERERERWRRKKRETGGRRRFPRDIALLCMRQICREFKAALSAVLPYLALGDLERAVYRDGSLSYLPRLVGPSCR